MMIKAGISDQKVKAKDFDQLVCTQANQNGSLRLDSGTSLSKEKSSDILQLKLAKINAIVNDEVEESLEPLQKREKIKLVLTENGLSNQGDILEEITEVINDHTHVNDQLSAIQTILESYKAKAKKVVEESDTQFASVQAVSKNPKSYNSNNFFIQTFLSLYLIESGQRNSTKEEEKLKERAEERWQGSVGEKAALYPKMAKDQIFWRNIYLGLVASSLVIPALGHGFAERSAKFSVENFPKAMTMGMSVEDLTSQIKTLAARFPELVNGVASQAVQVGSNTSSLLQKDQETRQDGATQQERQNLDNRIQVTQDLLREHQALRERCLEVIKTMTSQVIGR